jgi:hypothetical protein
MCNMNGSTSAPSSVTMNGTRCASTTDPTTGRPIVQCACPTFEGPYQVGQDLSTTGQSCVLGDNQVWSSAYATFEDGTIPMPPENGCLPDVPGGNGCPLLSPKPPVIPAVPSSVSCTQVCAEYGKSIHQGVEVGFTCDATLCTAQPDDSDLVQEACSVTPKANNTSKRTIAAEPTTPGRKRLSLGDLKRAAVARKAMR